PTPHSYTLSLHDALPILAATDEAARAEAKPHFEAFRNVFLKMPVEMLLPPGYTSRESLKNVMKAKAAIFGDITLEKSIELGLIIDRKSTRLNSSHGSISY